MNIAFISFLALIAAVVLSGWFRLNVGIFAISLAWIVGHYLGGISISTILCIFKSTILSPGIKNSIIWP